jgi:T-complex protein 1 subunit eta
LQGCGQMLSNISACMVMAVTVQTMLGPCGMYKLIHNNKGTTISNNGATIMCLLDIIHSAAKILVDIAKSQDSEVLIRLKRIYNF